MQLRHPFVGAMALLFVNACADPAAQCGTGTILDEPSGRCVSNADVPTPIECGPGTRLNAAGTACDVDPQLCPERTAFDAGLGRCVEVPAPAPTDDERGGGATALPADVGESVTLGGILDAVAGGAVDVDDFRFTATASTRLFVQVVGDGVPSPSFSVLGTGDALQFERLGHTFANARAARHVVIPVDGEYILRVTDAGTEGGIDVGGPDAAYAVVVTREAEPAPTVIEPDGVAHVDDLDAIAAYTISETSAAAFTVLDVVAEGLSEGTYLPAVWAVGSNGAFVQALGNDFGDDVSAAFVQFPGGTTFHVDYVEQRAVGPFHSSLSVTAHAAIDGLQVGDPPTVVDLGNSGVTTILVEAAAHRVIRARIALPESTTFRGIGAYVFSSRGRALCDGEFSRIECRHFADHAETFAIVVLNTEDPFPDGQFENTQVRVTLEDAPFTEVAVSLAGGAVDETIAAPDDDFDSWAGPWLLVTPADLAAYAATAGAAALRVFDATSFLPLEQPEHLRAPGDQILVQALGGAGAGDVVTITPRDANVIGEVEPNDTGATASELDAPVPLLPFPEDGACDPTRPPIRDSGLFASFLDGFGDDFAVPVTDCAFESFDSGNDFYYVLGPKPAGTTVTVRVDTPGNLATFGFLVGSCAGACVNPGFSGDTQSYTYDGTEPRVVFLVDALGFTSGDVSVEVVFSDDPLPPRGYGRLQGNDVDLWEVAAPAPGLITFSVANVSERGGMFATVFDADGNTLAGPDFFNIASSSPLETSVVIDAAQPLFLMLDTGINRDGFEPLPYLVSFIHDDSVAQPTPTCTAPVFIDMSLGQAGPFDRIGSGDPDFTPDASCFEGNGAAFLGGNAHAYEVTIPPQHRLTVQATQDFAGGIAILDGSSCADRCLASEVLADFGITRVTHKNEDELADQTVLVVIVRRPGDFFSDYSITMALRPELCLIGESRCADATTREVCPDGTGFVQETCGNGCVFDDFEQQARCELVCGFDDDGALFGPLERCNGDVLETCNFEGTRYVQTQCAVGCETVVPDLDALCTFDLCDRNVPATCAVDLGGNAIFGVCNNDESLLVETACPTNTCADAFSCVPSPDPAPSFCVEAPSCIGGVATSCAPDGTVRVTDVCAAGCDATSTACMVGGGGDIGESCDDAPAVTLGELFQEITVAVDFTQLSEDTSSACSSAPDGVVRLTIDGGFDVEIALDTSDFSDIGVSFLDDGCFEYPESCVVFAGNDTVLLSGFDPGTSVFMAFRGTASDATLTFRAVPPG